MPDDIIMFSATSLVEKIKKRQISVYEVMQSYVNQIEKINSKLNAIVQMNLEKALSNARQLDQTRARKTGRLIGLPITIKNVCHVGGFAPNKGCAQLAGNISPQDATIVKRLRDEGAIVVGLTNTPELSIGFETDNLLYGRSNNPYHLNHTPGGSSGGEAAIIAAGGSAVGIGSDASGSVRVPAHCTGIAAIKATQGRIPLTGTIPLDAPGLFSQFISFGPMAKYVEDLHLVLPTVCGPDNRDPHTVPVALRDMKQVDLSKLRIAYYSNDGIATPTPETVTTINNVAKALNGIALKIVEDRPAVLEHAEDLLYGGIFLGGDAGKWLTDIINHLKIKQISPLLQEFLTIAKASQFSVTDLRVSWQRLDQYRSQMLLFLENYDAIICPVSATPAKPHGTSFREIRDFSYSMSFTLVNWPAAVVRCGTADSGLPIGVQIIAHPWREDIALAIAKYLETTLGGWQPPPLT